jgi:Zn-dependent M16 (insulinase) family peptidase
MSSGWKRCMVAAAVLGACTSGERADERREPADPAPMTTRRTIADFVADAVYTDGRGGVMGTRWIHRSHGMPVTVLRIQSVPQVFLAFHTPPVSDRGEPHTGEHLLLGKGTKGKMLSAEQDMSLVESTAWTSQTDVCYSWSCAAGKDTFYRSVEQYLDALLLPDYTDEEIRREVCHVGPVKEEGAGKLSVDEKGTIYQEMTSTYEKRWNVWYEMQKRLWGADHPLGFSAGGDPAAVRTVEPRHVHDFHAAHYHLGADTQMIVALPDSVPEDEFLGKLSSQMAAVGAVPALAARPRARHPIPPARPHADRSLKVHPYPNANEGDGGTALFAWPPVPMGSQADRVTAQLFLSTLGEGQSATLYKRLMDRATREVDVDAAEMAAGLDASKIDLLPYVTFEGLPPRNADPARVDAILRVVREEIARVAAAAPGSPELRAFNEKALGKLAEREKGLKRQLDSPPLFGRRGSGGFWLDHLRLLDQDGAFERPVALGPAFAKIRAEIAAGGNPWTRVVRDFGLGETPYAGVSVPSKAELDRRTAEHAKRVEGCLADLTKRYGGSTEEALAKFSAEYDAKTAELEAMEKRLGKPRLVADVPLVPDPSIKLESVEASGVPGFRGVFDNMAFLQASVSLRLDSVPEDLYPWLSVLPTFLTDSGVVEDGRAMAYDEAEQRRAREIHGLSAEYAMRPSRDRRELRIAASGADLAEARRAVDWIELCLRHSRLDADNLPRLRDLVAAELRETRGALGGAEERWVNDPARAVRWQRDRLYLSTSSIHARLFQLARCEWRLMDAPPSTDALRSALRFAASTASGGDVKTTAAHLDAQIAEAEKRDDLTKNWVAPILRRWKEMVGDMASETIAADLATLAEVAAADVAVPPADALAQVRRARDALVAKSLARFVLTGSRANTDALLPRVAKFFDGFAPTASAPAWRLGASLVDRRLADHEPAKQKPVHYGLVHDAGTTGVFLTSAKAAGYDDLDQDALVGELASRVFGGSGAHAFFMKTWGSGLAYSNGLGVNAAEGRVHYYAERCPDLVQTMSFVTGLVRDADKLDDPYLAEYAVALAVTHDRESDEFESRTRAEADDRVDGDTPDRVARWRRAVLALKDRPDLWTAMKPRVVEAAGRVLPGVGPRSRDVEDGVFLVIAPEPMLARWEKRVRDAEGADEHVFRVHGRDFWIVDR